MEYNAGRDGDKESLFGMSEQCDDQTFQQFKQLYENPKTNIALIWPLAFADMPVEDFWSEAQVDTELPKAVKDFLLGEHCRFTTAVWIEETVFEAMVTSENVGCKSLSELCKNLYYTESADNKAELMTKLLDGLNTVPYSICVHLSFLVILLNLEFINEGNYELLSKAYERHKAGLEARGRDWKNKRCRRK